MASKKQNVVVVGGGSVGVPTARAIAAKLDTSRYKLILVTARPHYTHLPAMLRTVVSDQGNLENVSLMPYGNALSGKGEVKVGKVVSITEGTNGGSITLADGEQINYTVLVLALGNNWEGPLDYPDDPKAMAETIESWRSKIDKANSIVLVGGGAVGIELAGEIKDVYPRKQVTIVHGQDRLLNNTYPDGFRDQVLRNIRKTGTEIVLDDYVDEPQVGESNSIKTRKGKSIQADLVVQTRGGRPNTEFLRESLGASVLTSTGHVKVQPTLQLPNHPRIFAGGDIIDWNEQKQMGKAPGHAGVIAANVLALLKGKEARSQYKGSPEVIAVTIGKKGGNTYMGFLWGPTFGNFATKAIKSSHLFLEMTRKGNGLGKY